MRVLVILRRLYSLEIMYGFSALSSLVSTTSCDETELFRNLSSVTHAKTFDLRP